MVSKYRERPINIFLFKSGFDISYIRVGLIYPNPIVQDKKYNFTHSNSKIV